MKNQKHRVLSVLLAGILVMSIGGTSVLAETTAEQPDQNQAGTAVSGDQKPVEEEKPEAETTALESIQFDLSLEGLLNRPQFFTINNDKVNNTTGELGSQLEDYSVTIYNNLESALKNGTLINGTENEVTINLPSQTVPYDGSDVNEMFFSEIAYHAYDACAAFDNDHPEVFYNDGTVSMGGNYKINGSNITFNPTLTFTYSEEYQDRATRLATQQAVNEQVDSIVAAVAGKTPVEQIHYFNRWLTVNNQYNTLVGEGNAAAAPESAWELTSALLSGSADTDGTDGPVCEGYSRAFKVLCEKAGIPCTVVVGNGLHYDESGENVLEREAHMWNYVKLDDEWWAIDVTWNDPIFIDVGDTAGTKDYFLLGKEAFEWDHEEYGQIFNSQQGLFVYPELSSEVFYPNLVLDQLEDIIITSPDELFAGMKLSEITLSQTNPTETAFMLEFFGEYYEVAGTLSWSQPGQVLKAGTNEAVWTFTPDQVLEELGITILPVSGTVALEAQRSAADKEPGYQPVNSSMSATYTEGMTLSNLELPDRWSWKESGSTELHPGQTTFTAVYTPADPDSYDGAEAQVSVTVAKGQLDTAVRADRTSWVKGGDVTLTVTLSEKTRAMPQLDDIAVNATNAVVKTPLRAVSGQPNTYEAVYTLTGEVGENAEFTVTVGETTDYPTVVGSTTVQIVDDIYEYQLIGAPRSVVLGEDIDVTGFQIRTSYGSGKPDTTENVTLSMLSGYDKNATGRDSIGEKEILVKLDDKRTARFTIQVEDVMTGIAVNAPDKLAYDWSVTGGKLDLTGATVTPLMKSEIEQSAVAMTLDMMSVGNEILAQAGSYPVSVTYGGKTVENAFTITVNEAVVDTGIGTELPQEPVTEPQGTIEDLESIPAGVSLKLVVSTPAADVDLSGATETLLQNRYEITAFSVDLIDTAANASYDYDGNITITMPYPEGTGASGYDFSLYRIAEDGTVTLVPLQNSIAGLRFTVNHTDDLGTFVLGYRQQQNSGGLGGPVVEETAPGWTLNSVGWWYDNGDGSYTADDWQYIDGQWYYFNAQGYMATGWIQVDSDWFYLNPNADGNQGAMETGWIFADNIWFYLNPVSDGTRGAMKTGWIFADNNWFYLNPVSDGTRGAMETGWVFVNNNWFYLNPTADGSCGAMLTGWKWVDGKCYYFYEDGRMAAAETTPDGYQVDASGAWIV